MKLLILGAATLFLAACGGDGGISASGGGTVATEGSSITQVDLVPASGSGAGSGSSSGTNAQGECSESSRAEGIC